VLSGGVDEGPLCFLHVPKTAGTSISQALKAALGVDALSPRRMEASHFCCFDAFDRLPPQVRDQIAATDAEVRALGGFRVIAGHFMLPTLRRFAPPARVATALREPRARLLSHYVYLRTVVPLRTLWGAYGIHRKAEGSLADFLADASAATLIDNKVCRMLLGDDPRIRDGVFIADEDLESIAQAALERLEELGFVGLMEDRDAMWRGLSDHFGAELRPVRLNVTGAGEAWPGMLPLPPLGGEGTLELLDRRTEGDAILYRAVAAQARGGEAGARRCADAAFAEQLVRYGAFTA
jgi:hypothetical protein